MRVNTDKDDSADKKMNPHDLQDENYVKKMMENVDKMLYLTEDDIKL